MGRRRGKGRKNKKENGSSEMGSGGGDAQIISAKRERESDSAEPVELDNCKKTRNDVNSASTNLPISTSDVEVANLNTDSSPVTGNECIAKDEQSSLEKNPDSCVSSTETRCSFGQCLVSSLTFRGMKDVGIERMTAVQEAILPSLLEGQDVLAKAETGTGRTLAFLLPMFEVVLKSAPAGHGEGESPFLGLVLCPNLERALQVAVEAKKLLKYHPSIAAHVVTGGRKPFVEIKYMKENPCQIIIATPVRLRDHMKYTKGFLARLMGVKVLVLDEPDHLLAVGFHKDIVKIIDAVPKNRQTVLVSASVTEEVRQLCQIALRGDHKYINTVSETHSEVKQMDVLLPVDTHFSILYALLRDHIANNGSYKVLVYCSTSCITNLVANFLRELGLTVDNISSKGKWPERCRVSDKFHNSKGLVLVTDVLDRGFDCPDITLVLKMGLRADKVRFSYQLGSTGCNGKGGQFLSLPAPWDNFFMYSSKDFPTTNLSMSLTDPDMEDKVEEAMLRIPANCKEEACKSWLAYYHSDKATVENKRWLVACANEFGRSMGLDELPALSAELIKSMQLEDIPGLRTL